MATINRMLTLNPVEPAPFSFRAPSGLQTTVKVSLFDTTGAVMRQDLGLQMQLTSRSDGTIVSYAMPATDVVNGKAAASIAAADLTDPNGYNVHVYGTWRGGAELLGRGVLRLTGGPGIQQMPDDVIDTIDLSLHRGVAGVLEIALWHDEGKANPYAVASAVITAAIYAASGGALLVSFVVTPTGDNEVQLSLTAAQVSALPDRAWWTLVTSSGAGQTTLAQGNVTTSGP